jgi:hypothetical protein
MQSLSLSLSRSCSLPSLPAVLENDTTIKVRAELEDTPTDFVRAYPLTPREQNMCDELISLLMDTIEEVQLITYSILDKANDRLGPQISYNQRHDLLYIRRTADQFGQAYAMAGSYKFTKRSVNVWLARFADKQDTNLRIYAELLGISGSNTFIEARVRFQKIQSHTKGLNELICVTDQSPV